MDFQDILYEIRDGVAWITINRPDKMNAFRGTTCGEIIKALNKAGYDRNVGCIVLVGAGGMQVLHHLAHLGLGGSQFRAAQRQQLGGSFDLLGQRVEVDLARLDLGQDGLDLAARLNVGQVVALGFA